MLNEQRCKVPAPYVRILHAQSNVTVSRTVRVRLRASRMAAPDWSLLCAPASFCSLP